MSRVTLACAVIAGITAAACSLGMTDLSAKQDDGRGKEAATNAAPLPDGGGNGDDGVLHPATTEQGSEEIGPDTPVDAGAAAAMPDASVGCDFHVLKAKTAVNVGGGRGWRDAANALATDGNNAEATLSTDARETTLLELGGFDPPLPANATRIEGVLVELVRSSGSTCIEAQEVTADFADGPHSRGDVGDKWTGTRFYGGTTDKWGAATIAPATFGASLRVRVKARMTGNQQQCPHARDARLDSLIVRVHYCTN
jgi:hypothetical protein